VNSIYGVSPGYCLLAKIVQQACDSPDINVVDLGLGAEDYKDRFASTNRQALYLVLNRSLLDHFRVLAGQSIGGCKKVTAKSRMGVRAFIDRKD
jgi:CelD/BcsL family acetyltransferase involved in cellulose biosynthesis